MREIVEKEAAAKSGVKVTVSVHPAPIVNLPTFAHVLTIEAKVCENPHRADYVTAVNHLFVM